MYKLQKNVRKFLSTKTYPHSSILGSKMSHSRNKGNSELAFASLESLGQDKTFKSLESLVTFSKSLETYYFMILAGKLLQKTQKF